MFWLTRDGAHHPYSTKVSIECTYINLRIPSLKLFIKNKNKNKKSNAFSGSEWKRLTARKKKFSKESRQGSRRHFEET
jgi:hypothetical protein